ncbi:MAG: DUF4124 domain-containing protein [Pseudomonas sp.]|uniref:DUF4124 domain-containing protein n=1 Tax=Pseudomonas sp. TaxID=306 RepID=UPI00339B9622
MKLLPLLLVLLSPLCAAELYKWTDAQGRTHYGDRKPETATSLPIGGSVSVVEGVAVDARPQASASSKKLVMYGASWCGYCAKARRYFAANGIAYIEYDVDKQPQARKRFDALGGQGLPLFVYNGATHSGFSVEDFQSFYPAP